jgi:6-phosphogluconate dehydrogenase (decarboxylating)
VVYDVRRENVVALANEGAVGVASLAELVGKLAPPRAASGDGASGRLLTGDGA